MNMILGTKYQLRLIFFIFWTKYAQNGISDIKQKMRISPMNSAYSISSARKF